jgi:hypothetical protein
LDVRVAAKADDAEEDESGKVDLTSSDLELVDDGDDQTIGIRFAGLDLPRNATIVHAWVQFTADEKQTTATSLVIRAQASDDAPSFTTGRDNVSSRPRTTATAAWSAVPGWSKVGETGDSQRTPELAPLIQEIVSRPGWNRGHALALIVTGSGHRTACAFDKSASTAPLLHVEYR